MFMMFSGNTFNPDEIPNISLWYDVSDSTTITSAYTNLVSTVTGTVGLTSLVCSGDESATVFVGMSIKVKAVDVYTVSAVSTSVGVTTITTSTPLAQSYVAQAIATLRVSQLNDKSGNGKNATQGTAANQPLYANNQLNTLPSLLFKDSQSMAFGNIPNTYLGFSCFFVGNFNQDASANTFGNMLGINGVTANVAQRQPLYYYAKAAMKVENSVGTFDAVAQSVSSGQNFINYIQYDGATTIKTSFNSSTLASQAITQLTSSVSVGNIGNNCKGKLYEVILYNRNLTSAEYLESLYRLSKKWGITVS